MTVTEIVKLLAEYGIEWPGGPDNAVIKRSYANTTKKHQRKKDSWGWWLTPRVRGEAVYPSVGGYIPPGKLTKKATLYEEAALQSYVVHDDTVKE